MTLQKPEYEGLEGSDANVMVCSELTAGVLERDITVSISTNDLTALEGNYYNYYDVIFYIMCSWNFAVKRSNKFSVNIILVMLHFTAAVDYVSLDNFPLSYEAGSPLNSERCVNITILDDDVVEDDESLQVSLSTIDPVLLTPISLAEVIILTDNDSKNNNRVHC